MYVGNKVRYILTNENLLMKLKIFPESVFIM